MYSKYCKKYFFVPHIIEKEEKVRSFLKSIQKILTSPAVIFSTSDLVSLHLSNLKDDFDSDFIFLFSDGETVRTLVNKNKFYHSLLKYNIPHPKTYFPINSRELEEISRNFVYPMVVKPSISCKFYGAFNRKGFLAKSEKELVKYYLAASKLKIDTMVQEFVSGSETSLFGVEGYFDRSGVPKAFFAYRRLRGWPPVLGINSLMESVKISEVPKIKKITFDYLSHLGYTGIFEAEFKWDSRDGCFKLIEINPRSWLQNMFPTVCGINIVYVSYLDAIGEHVEYSEDYRSGLKWMHSTFDLQSSIEQYGIGGIKDWVGSFNRTIDWPYFSVDDVLPWARNSYQSLYMFPRILRMLLHHNNRHNIRFGT
jgi:predicted ATP-grasp superfamily ATP-dependent carboligase